MPQPDLNQLDAEVGITGRWSMTYYGDQRSELVTLPREAYDRLPADKRIGGQYDHTGEKCLIRAPAGWPHR